MTDMSKWENGRTLTPEEEPEYLKDFCAYLREQQTLSPVREEDDTKVCDLVPDEVAAHAADIIEELWGRLEEQYKEGIVKGMEIKEDHLEYDKKMRDMAYDITKGLRNRE
jgi:hypothetical protein